MKLEGTQKVHISPSDFLQLFGEGDGTPLKPSLYLEPFLK